MRIGNTFIATMLMFGTASLGMGFNFRPKTDIHIFYLEQDGTRVQYEASLDTFTSDCQELIEEGNNIIKIDFSHIILEEIPEIVLSLGSLQELNLVRTGIRKIDLRKSEFTGTLDKPFLLRLGGPDPIEEIYFDRSVFYRVWDGSINDRGQFDQRLGDHRSNRIYLDANAINSPADLSKFISLLCRNVLGCYEDGSKKSLCFVGASIFLQQALNWQEIEDTYGKKNLDQLTIDDKVEEANKNAHAIRLLLKDLRWTEETDAMGHQNNHVKENQIFGAIIQNFLDMLIKAREDYEAERISPVKSAKNIAANMEG